jgi:hypothetical protein
MNVCWNMSHQIKEQIASLNPVVIKSHDLIDARFPDLTLKEKQLFLLAISLITPDAAVDRPIQVRFPRSYLEMVFGTSNYTSKALLAIAEGLVNRSIHIKGQKDGDWEIVNIMASAKYKDGQFSMTFNMALNEHFLSLRPITTYHLALIADLSSFYQIRLYEILLKELDKGNATVCIDLDAFRRLSGLEGRYLEYRTMKRCVLSPAVAAVSEHTDIVVDFEEIRTGRAVTALRFKMVRKRDLLKQEDESEEHRAIRAELEAIGFGPDLINLTLQRDPDLTLEQLREAIAAGRDYIEKGEARGEPRVPIAVYRKAIAQKWSHGAKSVTTRPRKPKESQALGHPSHKIFTGKKEGSETPDPHDGTIKAMLSRLSADAELHAQFMQMARKRGLFETIERMTLAMASHTAPVRQLILDFARQKS